MDTFCHHQNQIWNVGPRTPGGCEECLESGRQWLHLRLCLTCGHVGCCDASAHQHARAHFHATGHPIIESYAEGDRWRWCYIDQQILPAQAAAIDGDTAATAGAPDAGGGSSPLPPPRPGGLLSRLIGSLHRDNYLVGVIDNLVSATRGAHALEIYGFAPSDIFLQPGSEIARRMLELDFEGLAREATLEEGSICRQYNEMARDGAVLSVLTPTPADVRRACHIMTAYDAHSLMHFGDWTISELPAEERCWI